MWLKRFPTVSLWYEAQSVLIGFSCCDLAVNTRSLSSWFSLSCMVGHHHVYSVYLCLLLCSSDCQSSCHIVICLVYSLVWSGFVSSCHVLSACLPISVCGLVYRAQSLLTPRSHLCCCRDGSVIIVISSDLAHHAVIPCVCAVRLLVYFMWSCPSKTVSCCHVCSQVFAVHSLLLYVVGLL